MAELDEEDLSRFMSFVGDMPTGTFGGLHEDDNDENENGVVNRSLLGILTQKMKNLGILPYEAEDLAGNDITRFIQSTLDLLKLYQKLVDAHDGLRSRYLRTCNDLTCAQRCTARLKDAAEQRERTIRGLQESQLDLTREKATLNKKIKSAQDEIKYLMSVAQTHGAQHRNELRKKDVEINKLKDRLHASLSARGSGSEKSSGGERLRNLSFTSLDSDITRQKWRTTTSDLRQKECLPKREPRHIENENEVLRRILSGVCRQLKDVVSSSCTKQECENLTEGLWSNVTEGHFKSPLTSTTAAQIEEYFRLKMTWLKEACSNA